MKTISQDRFVEIVSEALPELIASIMREDTSAVSTGQVSVPQFWALHYISRREGLTVNELATDLNRGKSSTSCLLQRLEKAGLVRRRRNRSDQRVVNIDLTVRGRQLVEQITDSRKRGIRRTYAALSDTERTRHAKALEKVVRNVRCIVGAITLTALLSTSTDAQTTNAYTLDESIRIGLQRSLTVANSARQREIAEARRTGALSEALPRLTSRASYARNFPEEINGFENFSGRETRSLYAEASWQVFAGGRTLSAIRASKAYRKLTAYQEERVRSTQAKDISLAYYDVQLAKKRIAALSDSVQQLADFETETRLRYEAGTVSEFDWLSAKVALANEKPRLIAAQNALSLTQEQFRNLTFIDDEVFALSDPLRYEPADLDLHQVIELAHSHRAVLQEKGSEVELRRLDVRRQKGDLLPRVDLFADYGYLNPDPSGFFTGGNGWQYQLSTGVRASWELFDGGRRRANIAESSLNMMIAENEYHDLERYVALDVRMAWLRGRDAAVAIEATTETVELARRALEIARSRFDAGLGTFLEVTQANVELSSAQLARSQALYEHMASVTEMKYAAGILLKEYE